MSESATASQTSRRREGATVIGQQRRPAGQWATTFRRFRRHRLAVCGLIVIVCLGIAAISAPFLPLAEPNRGRVVNSLEAPSRSHLLGTDAVGRDVLSRSVHGSRVSLSVGLVGVSMYLVIGVSLGALAGYYGGVTDAAIMRTTDVFMSFPPIILIVTLVALLGPSLYNVMIAIGLLGWPSICRLVRGQFLSLREREFVEAARAIGVRDSRLIFRHVLPSAITPVVVSASFGLAEAILLEAGLSFLGLGVQAPTASWGGMLNAAQSMTTLRDYPWMWFPPGLLIFLTVVSINFVGDGLRDALDPRSTR